MKDEFLPHPRRRAPLLLRSLIHSSNKGRGKERRGEETRGGERVEERGRGEGAEMGVAHPFFNPSPPPHRRVAPLSLSLSIKEFGYLASLRHLNGVYARGRSTDT